MAEDGAVLIRRVLERLAGMGSRSEPPSPGSDSARRYEVLVVGRTTDLQRSCRIRRWKCHPQDDSPLLDRKVDARQNLRLGCEQVSFGASYTGYMLDPYDDRDHITRLDASYVAVGPIPTADVAEGGVSEAGLAMIDPTGEARRQGKVLRFRARA